MKDDCDWRLSKQHTNDDVSMVVKRSLSIFETRLPSFHPIVLWLFLIFPNLYRYVWCGNEDVKGCVLNRPAHEKK